MLGGQREEYLTDLRGRGGFPKKVAVARVRAETERVARMRPIRWAREQFMKGFMGPAEEFALFSEDNELHPC